MREAGFNLFQRLARRWDAVHPYNAAQVMRIRGRIDPAEAADVWAATLRSLGLGPVRVTGGHRFRHEVLNGEMAHYPLRTLAAGTSLEDYLSAEMNRPFDDPAEPPFRPFLITHENEYQFGVVYQHWVADSVSIRYVLREWFRRVFDPGAVSESRLRTAGAGYWAAFGRRGNWRAAETLLGGVRSHVRHRRARKIRTSASRQYPVCVSLPSTPAGYAANLRSCARGHGVKVHDVLLAATAAACDRYVPFQIRRERTELSIGSVVDLRPYSTGDLDDTFGLFLGFLNVFCRPGDLRDWNRLVRSVASQSRKHKQNGLAQSSMFWMTAALGIAPLVPADKLYAFYRKQLPMAGGLSNVSLNDTWPARYYPDPLREYVRISPTGPLVPIAFAVTTLGPDVTLAITHRSGLMTPERVNAMAEFFLGRCNGA